MRFENFIYDYICYQIRDAIENRLATKVKVFCKTSPSERIQPLLDLLGKQFVEKYLSDLKLLHNNQVNFQ